MATTPAVLYKLVNEQRYFSQVWTLTQFFMFPFCKKIIDLAGGQINDPSWVEYCSLSFIPATPLFWSHEELFEPTTWQGPSPRVLLPEL